MLGQIPLCTELNASQMPGDCPGGGDGRFWNWLVHKCLLGVDASSLTVAPPFFSMTFWVVVIAFYQLLNNCHHDILDTVFFVNQVPLKANIETNSNWLDETWQDFPTSFPVPYDERPWERFWRLSCGCHWPQSFVRWAGTGTIHCFPRTLRWYLASKYDSLTALFWGAAIASVITKPWHLIQHKPRNRTSLWRRVHFVPQKLESI